jgi:hypothetical protein
MHVTLVMCVFDLMNDFFALVAWRGVFCMMLSTEYTTSPLQICKLQPDEAFNAGCVASIAMGIIPMHADAYAQLSMHFLTRYAHVCSYIYVCVHEWGGGSSFSFHIYLHTLLFLSHPTQSGHSIRSEQHAQRQGALSD